VADHGLKEIFEFMRTKGFNEQYTWDELRKLVDGL
jgi:hypothetical protein